ncbi:MAG: radical SAM protein [Clostridium sp.]|nr:radical SAM protein [Clostridium sp.]
MNSTFSSTYRFMSAPLYADISITDRCNLACMYCYANASIQNADYMDVQLFNKVSMELEACGVSYMRIAGGEPLMHPKISDILNIAGKCKMLTSMSTNATLVDMSIAKMIHNSGLNWIVVSLDGADKNINNLTRDGYHHVIHGIECLIKTGIRTKLATVVSSANYLHFGEIIRLAEDMHIASIGFLLFSAVGRACKNIAKLQMNFSQLREFIIGINEYKAKNKNGIKINIVFPHESIIPWQLSAFLTDKEISQNWISTSVAEAGQFKRSIGCMAGFSTCAITPDGRLFGCEQMTNFDELCAGYLKTESFLRAWNQSSVFHRLRSTQITNLDERCIHCTHVGCGGGCRAIAYSQTHHINGFDDSCTILNQTGDA